MTRASAKKAALQLVRRWVPTELHDSIRFSPSFQVVAVSRLHDGSLEAGFIPFLNRPGVCDALRAIERKPGFEGWAVDPFTGRRNIEWL
jgi:hypothetical protein